MLSEEQNSKILIQNQELKPNDKTRSNIKIPSVTQMNFGLGVSGHIPIFINRKLTINDLIKK
jgi:hypothetical protein